jgi:hypothetical protein
MSHGRPPRRVRYKPAVNMLAVVVNRATRLTPTEVDQVMRPIHSSLTALRQGVANDVQWGVLCSAIEVGLAIEDQGVVRGLRGHLCAAEEDLASIGRRALDESGNWRPTALDFHELEHITEAVRLHQYQIEQLSAGELAKIHQAAKSRVLQDGGRVISLAQVEACA